MSNVGRPYEEVETSSVKLSGDEVGTGASGAKTGDKFGSSVAITGGTSAGATLASVTVVVGAPKHDKTTSTVDTGGAFVYKLGATGTVIKTSRLVANDATWGSYFGTSVAADGDWVVVGAPNEDNQPTSSSVGAVYVFKRDANDDYPQVKKLVSPNPAAFSNNFGDSVAISGNYIVVGEPKGMSDRGRAHVFKYVGGDWIYDRELSGTLGGTDNDDFGKSVSVDSSSYILVGAPATNTSKGSSAGSAYLFNLDGTRERTFTATDGAENHEFGRRVSISGKVFAVSSPRATGEKLPARRLLGNMFSGPGAVYVFERKDTGSYTTNKVTANDQQGGAAFGSDVSVSGEYFVVGAYYADAPGTDDDRGSAYIQHVQHVSTVPSGGDCSLCNNPGETIFFGDCGGLANKNKKKWSCDGPYCCASSSDDCCEVNGGAIAGIVIGCVVGLALAITACAYCCKCCCFKPKQPTTYVMTQQPGMQMAPMGQVQMQPMVQVPYGQQPMAQVPYGQQPK